MISSQKEGELVFGVLLFERGFAGEEGGAAVVGRQPPSSPMERGWRWELSLAERLSSKVKRENGVQQMNSRSQKLGLSTHAWPDACTPRVFPVVGPGLCLALVNQAILCGLLHNPLSCIAISSHHFI